MKKLSLIAMKSDADRLTARLLRLACVEVTRQSPGEEGEGTGRLDCGEEMARCSEQLRTVQNAIRILSAYDQSPKKLFPPRRRISPDAYENSAEMTENVTVLASVICGKEARRKEIEGERAACSLKMTALAPWKDYELPLGMRGTDTASLRLGTLPLTVDPDSIGNDAVPISCEVIAEDKRVRYLTALFAKRDESEAAMLLAEAGFLQAELTGLSGTAAEEEARLQDASLALMSEDAELVDALTRFCEKLPLLKEASDHLTTRRNAIEAKTRLCCTDQTVSLTGWVPEGMEKKVGNALDSFDCSYEMTDPTPEDEPPTLLLNKKHLDPFEMVIGLYSLPAYGSFDPTFVMSIFYFIIFGMMLADAVYGLLLIVACFGALKLFELTGGTKKLVKLFGICGISCLIWGVLFGSYFGDFPVVFAERMLGKTISSPAILFDPVGDPISFLILSLVVGAVHLLAGMAIKAYVLVKTGRPWAALFDVGSWFILFAGIGLYFVNPIIGIVDAAIGALMLILTQGREKKGIFGKISGGLLSLYDIVNYVSDLLSYSRIMALGMSSAVIASVLNIISTLKGPSVAGYLIMTVVVLLGNLLNLAINLLGSFVHASRLQYIEFFGKFYEDGGRPFDPVLPSEEYTVAEEPHP